MDAAPASTWRTRAGAHLFNLGATWDRSRVSFAQFEQDAFFTPRAASRPIPDEAREPASSVTGSARALGVYGAATLELSGDPP
jgi:hypothetical protein